MGKELDVLPKQYHWKACWLCIREYFLHSNMEENMQLVWFLWGCDSCCLAKIKEQISIFCVRYYATIKINLEGYTVNYKLKCLTLYLALTGNCRVLILTIKRIYYFKYYDFILTHSLYFFRLTIKVYNSNKWMSEFEWQVSKWSLNCHDTSLSVIPCTYCSI
jgi:hypothetical protein